MEPDLGKGGTTDMSVSQLWEDIESGQLLLVDVRSLKVYCAAHVPAAVNVPYGGLQGWAEDLAQWLKQVGLPFCLFADDVELASAALGALGDHDVSPTTVWDKGAEEWQKEGGPIVSVANIEADDLKASLDNYAVLDVREPIEWRTGTIPGSIKISLGQLPQQWETLDRGRAYAVVCAHGNRSLRGAAFLADHGFDASSVAGGMKAWSDAGHPVERN